MRCRVFGSFFFRIQTNRKNNKAVVKEKHGIMYSLIDHVYITSGNHRLEFECAGLDALEEPRVNIHTFMSRFLGSLPFVFRVSEE